MSRPTSTSQQAPARGSTAADDPGPDAGMRYRRLGRSGLAVSVLGLGCNNFGARMPDDAVPAVVDACLDEGVTLFDTADVYGDRPGRSEELLGRALAGRREQAVVATKVGADVQGLNGPDFDARGSRRYLRLAVESSLRRLGTDWIDLLQLHRPDPLTPVEETLAALHELVTEGKVRYLGSSNFAAWQVVDADWTARQAGTSRFVAAQNHYSLLERGAEAELLPACRHVGVGLLPYFPLASGLLTGKYVRGADAPEGTRLATLPHRLAAADFDRVEAISDYAHQRGLSMLDVAVGGLAAQPGVASVIAGATRPEQVRANAAASRWQPDAADLAALDAATPPP